MSFFEDAICLLLKTNPLFWQVYFAVLAARASGAITTLDGCRQATAVGGVISTQFGVPSAISSAFGNCACRAVFDANEGPVVVFEDDGFQGDSQSFHPGTFLANRGELDEVGNDEISSLVVAPGFRVRLCEHEGDGINGGGECHELGPGQYPSLSAAVGNPGFNDRVSFIRVMRI